MLIPPPAPPPKGLFWKGKVGCAAAGWEKAGGSPEDTKCLTSLFFFLFFLLGRGKTRSQAPVQAEELGVWKMLQTIDWSV